ncbi:MAG: NAD-dependent epimerase/dehydratase family protein [Syntrophales bacterium]
MFYKGKKILVTGGTGFVGSHFVEELLQRGAYVRVPTHRRTSIFSDPAIETMPADLTRLEDCLKACEGMDFVCHAAGAVAAANVTLANPMSAITANLILTARMLEAAMEKEVQRFLIFSSGTTAYPLSDKLMREEEMWDAPPAAVYFGYGWMRRYLEILGTFAASKSALKVAICRPTAVYGRRDDFQVATSHVIPALICRAALKEDPFIVWGTGKEVRDFLHVTDLVRGCLLLLEKHASSDPINIGYGKGASIARIVEIILQAAGHSGAKVVFDASKPTTIPVRIVDTTKARTLLNFKPRVSLEDGISDTVNWYLNEKTASL